MQPAEHVSPVVAYLSTPNDKRIGSRVTLVLCGLHNLFVRRMILHSGFESEQPLLRLI